MTDLVKQYAKQTPSSGHTAVGLHLPEKGVKVRLYVISKININSTNMNDTYNSYVKDTYVAYTCACGDINDNNWIIMEIEQKIEEMNYVFSVSVNGQLLAKTINLSPAVYDNVLMMMPVIAPVDGVIRKLFVLLEGM